MAGKNLEGIGGKPPLKTDKKSVVTEENTLREAKKDPTKAEYALYEPKPTEQMHSRLTIRDDDPSDPWYFTHM